MKINANEYPNLANLLTLRFVIPQDTTVYDEDSDCEINLCELLEEVAKEVEG